MYERILIEYLPEFLRDIREYKAILTDGVQPEVIKLFQAVEDAMNDQFVTDATENGVSRWEKMLKIIPKATHSLDDRKFAILTKMNEQLPYTMTSLKQSLSTLCGEDGYSVEVDDVNYVLIVRVALTAENNYDEVSKLLERVVPANMIIDLSLMYNQHKFFNSYSHDQLSGYTHEQLKREEIDPWQVQRKISN